MNTFLAFPLWSKLHVSDHVKSMGSSCCFIQQNLDFVERNFKDRQIGNNSRLNPASNSLASVGSGGLLALMIVA